jgi:uncharacterized protein (TIGR00375 family)
MEFVADLHIHSHYARATSPSLTFPELYRAAMYKGVHVVGTGDFTHGGWVAEIQEFLAAAPEQGLYSLKPAFAKEIEAQVPELCLHPVRFLLTAEISSIYKKKGRTRKVHNVVCAPDLESVHKIRSELAKIGNLESDGRPILGLDCHDLLDILLNISPRIYVIPAHIWTPWFSVLGAQSGFDDVSECFADLTAHIFSVETGLSSDPAMNWMCSRLDRFTLVSNSDAHSPGKLAREANLFNCELSYDAIFDALRTADPEKFLGTIEFYPEEGKYHLDGHRKCDLRWTPEESLRHDNMCVVCGKPITVGVMHRVSELADRKAGEKSPRARPFQSLIGLDILLGEVLGVGESSKKVGEMSQNLSVRYGSELHILQSMSLDTLAQQVSPLFAEAIRRARVGELDIQAGYDGEFGTIRLFRPGEQDKFGPQASFFQGWGAESVAAPKKRTLKEATVKSRQKKSKKTEAELPLLAGDQESPETNKEQTADFWQELNAEQRAAVEHRGAPLLVVAGPGTGKTRTLTCRLAHLLLHQHVPAQHILAVTFTNKAAEEMRSRLTSLLANDAAAIFVCTFHRLALKILQAEGKRLALPDHFVVYDAQDIRHLLGDGKEFTSETLDAISQAKARLLRPKDIADAELCARYQSYQEALQRYQGIDLDDLLLLSVRVLEEFPAASHTWQQQWQVIAVDEYQDINLAQYRLLRMLVHDNTDLCAIGDPDQAIYGFRGSEVKYFLDFAVNFAGSRCVQLTHNYRSGKNILEAADSVIRHNRSHIGSNIEATLPAGERVRLYEAASAESEAEFVVKTMEELIGGTSHFSLTSGRSSGNQQEQYTFASFAVLYRLNAQSKVLEEALSRSAMPYQIVAGTSLWKSREFKLWRTLLQLVAAPQRELEAALLLPELPGVGARTLAYVRGYAREHELSLMHTLQTTSLLSGVAAAARPVLQEFSDKIKAWHLLSRQESTVPLVGLFLREITWPGWQLSAEQARLLLDTAARFTSLTDLLAYMTLQRPSDDLNYQADKITLMTLHAAKGLEFPVVFVTGCEDSLLPYRYGNGEAASDVLEEERRLFYVGMTRARSLLYLVRSRERMWQGKRVASDPSPYLAELPQTLVQVVKSDWKKKTKTEAAGEQLSFF